MVIVYINDKKEGHRGAPQENKCLQCRIGDCNIKSFDAHVNRWDYQEGALEINQPTEFCKMPIIEQDTLCSWICKNITQAKRINYHSSYGLKHIFEADRAHGGQYVNNGQFKGAMLVCGFAPTNKSELNWRYRVKLNKTLEFPEV